MEIKDLPLGALHTFLAAARCLSFTEAGKELFITQGAVSQRILKLEKQLHIQLFLREPKGLVLTPEGIDLVELVTLALNELASGIGKLQARQEPKVFTISMASAFGNLWFINRLQKLQTILPDTRLNIRTEKNLVDFKQNNIDAAIRYGRGDYPGLISTRLTDLSLFLVAKPGKTQSIVSTEELNQTSLLHHNTLVNNGHRSIWQLWFDAHGAEFPSGGHWFNDREVALQAAAAGQGIAVSNHCLSGDDLEKGRLVRVSTSQVSIDESYYLVHPENNNNKNLVIFRQWLLEELKKSESLHGQLSP